jgi:hypothetical protein
MFGMFYRLLVFGFGRYQDFGFGMRALTDFLQLWSISRSSAVFCGIFLARSCFSLMSFLRL